ncbi:MAG: methyl-accepting chemotaxis protein [Treponema sp.]|jgi:methyl-accepting chemotaxis protein|nr:methyl-accepting chemotaxis protein [Treponema sp.]
MKNDLEKTTTQGRKVSAKRKALVFSVLLFLLISASSSTAFVFFMYRIALVNAGIELAKQAEIERIKLEALVNAEIAIALKMATSPLIQQYFMNPSNPELERMALEEIASYRQAFAGKSVFWVNDIDHRFYSDDAYAFTIDTSDPNNYWYHMTLFETEKYNFNINYNPDLDVTNLWINAPVFDSMRNPIGVVGTGIDLTAFIDFIYENFTGYGSLYFFNTLNEITGAKDASLVTNKVTLDAALGDIGVEILTKVRNHQPGEAISLNISMEEAAVTQVPSLEWFIAIVLPVTIADALNSPMTALFVVMMVVIAGVFVIFYLFISQLLKPLNIMMRTLGQIAEDWDLRRKLKILRRDEIGALAEFLNLTFEKIRSLLKAITNEAKTLSEIGNELATNSNETAATMGEIAVSVQGVKTRVLNQSASVSETNATMVQVVENIEKLNGHVEKQGHNISQASSAIEEMVANIQSVNSTLAKNSANVKTLNDASEVGRSGLADVASDIQEIARESEGLLEINAVMENIASQTNLLSMNAAIEAAHAGEAGKGFAVVADEIRKLAESSSEQSKTISSVLKKIKSSIDKITSSTENVLGKFEAIDSNIRVVMEQEETIRSAMEEQGTGSRQILNGIGNVNNITQDVKNGSQEMLQGSQEVIRESENLEQITQDIISGMNEMVMGAEHINKAVNHVKEISDKNRKVIDNLMHEVSRFKVE